MNYYKQQESLNAINGACNVPIAINNTLIASATPTATTKKVNISILTSNLDFSCAPTKTPTPIASTATPPPPPILSSSVSSASVVVTTQIKKKTSSFLHRDYNRKPILARSQVSKIFIDQFKRNMIVIVLLLDYLKSYQLYDLFP